MNEKIEMTNFQFWSIIFVFALTCFFGAGF